MGGYVFYTQDKISKTTKKRRRAVRDEFEVGDEIELRRPYRGYSYGTIIAEEWPRFRVEFSSGMEGVFYADEFKDK
jgi:hypothetical protein